MFYFLMISGIFFIITGILIKKTQTVYKSKYDISPAINNDQEKLVERVEHLEKLLFESLLRIEEKENKIPQDEQSGINKPDMPDNVRIIMEYARQGLGIQEISKITGMHKGEVLLLKNLSKYYLK